MRQVRRPWWDLTGTLVAVVVLTAFAGWMVDLGRGQLAAADRSARTQEGHLRTAVVTAARTLTDVGGPAGPVEYELRIAETGESLVLHDFGYADQRLIGRTVQVRVDPLDATYAEWEGRPIQDSNRALQSVVLCGILAAVALGGLVLLIRRHWRRRRPLT